MGAKPDPLTGTISTPSEATLRRALAKVDTAQLQRMSTEWTQALRAGASDGESARLPAVAIDGKSVRGAAAGGNPRPHAAHRCADLITKPLKTVKLQT